MTPAVPKPATARTANASCARGASLKSSMVSSAVGLPTYGGEPRSDCVYGRLDPLPGAHEERLLRGLRRAARGLFRHRAQIGPQSGGRRKRDDSPAAGPGVERADAHRILALLDGPELVDPARRSGREVERRHDDEATHPVPVKPHGGCLAGGGEIRGAARGCEDGCPRPVWAVELGLPRRDGAAKPVSLGPAAPIPIPRHDGERDRCGRGDPGEARRTSGAERPNLPGFAQYAVAQTRRGRRRRGGVREGSRHFAERLDVGAACRALGEVGLERGALLRFESVERVRPSELAVPFVIGHDASLESSGASEPRSFSIPARMRVLTVPNGSRSSAAISVCVRPPKYASSITRRCTSGSSASERATSRWASSRSMPRSGASPAAASGAASPSLRSLAARASARARRPRDRNRSRARVRVMVASHAATLPRLRGKPPPPPPPPPHPTPPPPPRAVWP